MSNPHSSIGENAHVRRQTCVTLTIIGLLMMFAFLFIGCEQQRQNVSEYPSTIDKLAIRHEQPDPLIEAQKRGHLVYEHYCQICHGPDAQGNGFNAAMLDPPPRNFADETFWKEMNEDRLRKVIEQGGHATGKSKLMPTWGRTLDRQQIRDVVDFLRTVPETTRSQQEENEAAE